VEHRSEASPLVVDASVAIAWRSAKEATHFTNQAFIHAARFGVVVPTLWWYEVFNFVALAERRARGAVVELSRFDNALATFRIEVDEFDAERVGDDILTIARRHQLTVYDAAYLELAIRRNAQLATLDKALIDAAGKADVALFNP